MKYAVKKLDDSRFRSHEGEIAYVRVREDSGRSRSRSRSYSPRKRSSPTYSPGILRTKNLERIYGLIIFFFYKSHSSS